MSEKSIEAQSGKLLTPTRVIDALIGEKERMQKRREKKVRNGERASYPTNLDNSVPSYDPQGSYGEPFL